MPPVASKPLPRSSSSGARPARCVVLVDDEASYIDVLEQLLGEHLSCPVMSFNNPRRALKGVRSLDVGMIVTDYSMPGLTGLQFITEVQKFMTDVPVVMITAYPVDFAPEELARVPALKAVVRKPFRWPVLAEQISKHWPSGSSPPFRTR